MVSIRVVIYQIYERGEGCTVRKKQLLPTKNKKIKIVRRKLQANCFFVLHIS